MADRQAAVGGGARKKQRVWSVAVEDGEYKTQPVNSVKFGADPIRVDESTAILLQNVLLADARRRLETKGLVALLKTSYEKLSAKVSILSPPLSLSV